MKQLACMAYIRLHDVGVVNIPDNIVSLTFRELVISEWIKTQMCVLLEGLAACRFQLNTCYGFLITRNS